MTESSTAEVQLDRLATETILVPIIGTSPLIVHKFSKKNKQAMRDAQGGKKAPKVARNPEQDYEDSLYPLGNGYGFPILAFKSATVSAARFYKDIPMTALRQFIFFHGELSDGHQLARLKGKPRMREDTVRLNGRTTDLRYRGEFMPWSTNLKVTYINSVITRSSVLSLIDAGGLGVGVGEWRPEKRGDFGTYEIDTAKTVEVVER